eukprot:s1401_g5.t1
MTKQVFAFEVEIEEAFVACERAHEWQRAMLTFHQIQAKLRSSASYCTACTALSRAQHWQQSLQLLCTATASNLASRPLMGAAIFGAASGAAWQDARHNWASLGRFFLRAEVADVGHDYSNLQFHS